MDTIYKTYERFIEAAKKFPRWNNTRRRPTTSVGGKLLQSIIEEIGKVEDAIIEYKKDFFIVNYIGRENKIADYLYNVQIGEITNISALALINPELTVTTDIYEFYLDLSKAYYQDGYLVFRNEVDEVEYTYNSFIYKRPAEKFHVWNIFDEFAWWVGLQRFDGEKNKDLMNRSVNIFRYRPNSTEEGLKNVIWNTLNQYGNIDMDEIKFEIPDQNNLTILNNDGISLYEEIARFNRDIARTKKWDIDYWDNSFRTLSYIAHVWDTPVKFYKDGVGYNNSLYVSTVRDLDTERNTDVTITGYKKSQAKVEEYIRDHDITKDIELGLVKYNNEVNPIPVQYMITASTLTKIDNPDQIYVDAYLTSNKEQKYSIDSLFESKENINVIQRNNLEPNTNYRLKFTPGDKESTFEITSCNLIDGSNSKSLLEENHPFGFDDRGIFVNKNVLYYGDSVNDFNNSTNLEDYRYGGVQLINEALPGYFELDISDYTNIQSQPLTIETECDLYDIMTNRTYVSVEGFTLSGGSYVSDTSALIPSVMTIALLGRDIEFEIDKADPSSLSNSYVDIETYIDGKLSLSNSYYNVSASTFKKYTLKQNKMRDIKITIKRNNTTALKVTSVKATRYELDIKTSAGESLTISGSNTITIPQHTGTYYLYVTVNSYGQTRPIIRKVKIGATLNNLNSAYYINFNTNNTVNPVLSIESNCTIELENQSNNTTVDYYPMNLYVNNSDEIQGIYLDLSNFSQIQYSSPEIYYGLNGRAYIMVNPGESISEITIYGKNEKIINHSNLKDIFNLGIVDVLYANKNVKGFIKKSGMNEFFVELTEDLCTYKNADSYRVWSNTFNNLKVCYISNSIKNAESIGKRYNGHFESVYIYDDQTVEYIAYNNQNIVRNKTENVDLVKNFSPVIPSGTDLLYYINDVTTRSDYNFEVTFDNGNRWSTSGNRQLIITTDIDLSEIGVINTTLKDFIQNFTLSNTIGLNDTYTIGNETINLSQYIITPPDYMDIVYDEISVVESRSEDGSLLYVEEDGFNKLVYSNVVNIIEVKANGLTVIPEYYSLMPEEGILCWNTDIYTGAVLQVTYTYKKPKYLTFSSLDYLYDLVGYYIDTMELVSMNNDYIINDVEDGTIININYDYFVEKPDKIIAECSNPCYTALFGNDSLLIKKIAEDDSILVHNGYYYIDGKEYWYFADRFERESDQVDGVKFINVEKLEDHLLLQQEAENYLKNSKMACNKLDTHCIVDFNYYTNIPNISSLDHIGACDSFSNWKSYNMTVSLGNDYDNHTIIFSSNDSDGYAVLDITHALFSKKFISCWFMGTLNFCLGRERRIGDQQLSKTLWVERLENFNVTEDKAWYDGKNLEPSEYRYYIIVTGSGTLIETLITDSDSEEDINSDHEKAISKLGLSFEEEVDPGTIIELDFDPTGAIYDDTEMSKDLQLQTGTSVDWGVTKIEDFDFNYITNRTGFLLRNDILIAQEDGARLRTNTLTLTNRRSINNVILKVNDYQYDKLAGFTLKAYGCNTENGNYVELRSVTDDNFLMITPSRVMKYMYFEIEAEEDKRISHIEVFVQYKENESEALRVTEALSGTCTTKIYDVMADGNYVLKTIKAEEENSELIKYEIQAARLIDNDVVWTGWYDYNDQHIFSNYRLFQLRITLKSPSAKTRIKKLIFEVVE